MPFHGMPRPAPTPMPIPPLTRPAISSPARTILRSALQILLDFVHRRPISPRQTVAKEQGIIGQEIGMYDDDPDWRVMLQPAGARSIRSIRCEVDIAGTVETIAQINADLLYRCYDYLLQPAQHGAVGSGQLRVRRPLCVPATEILQPAAPITVERAHVSEPEAVRSAIGWMCPCR